MEYKLTCITGGGSILEITRPSTPELRTAIGDHFEFFAASWTGKNHPLYRDGAKFYMRPWYYINSLEFRINDTSDITKQILSNEFGESYCSELYDNPKLFIPDEKRRDPTNYIRSQDFIWFLSIIAPRLKHQR